MKRESIAFTGKIGEVVHIEQEDGRVFEQYRRAPGIRLIIISPKNKILITKEHRTETDGIDLRLPGGKVRDSIEEWHKLVNNGQNILDAVREIAIKEGSEETGLDIKDPTFLVKANAGSTVQWDLFYWVVRDYKELPGGQQLEHGEDISVTWMSPNEIITAISNGQMNEWRSVGVLLGLVLPQLDIQ
ncbi:MAG TPA: NUDIX hydrolase [Candidatus Saccharimonadia bacterium]|nr:NUDIX hydrolase [Candidatus Saccharimonadia bacterium]